MLQVHHSICKRSASREGGFGIVRPADVFHRPAILSECALRLCSGKSTVGKLVASALKYPFLDSDTLIEQLAGCTISDIFREEGEESFREVESQVLQVGARHSFFFLK